MRTRAPCTSTPCEPRVGPREVEELEDAERAAARPAAPPGARSTPSSSMSDQLARADLALEVGADEVERAGLGGDTQSSLEPAEAERPDAVRVAEGDQLPLGERDDREGALELRIACATASSSGASSFAISAAITSVSDVVADACPSSRELLAELGGVRQVAVVAERDRARAAVVDERLRVRPLRSSRSSSSACGRSRVAVQAAQLLLVEDLRHEPHVAQRGQPAVVGDGDPGRLLAAVLEREQAEVGRAARRRARASGCRRRRTSAHRRRCAAGPWCRAARRRPVRRRSTIWPPPAGSPAAPTSRAEPRILRGFASASSRPPSDTSCASVSTGAAFQTKRTSAASAARSSSPGAVARRTTSPLRQRPGNERTSGTSPTQPTTGVGGIDRPSVSL